ncbi:MAG: DUF4424 domain-containing protein [Turneriella sp.]|nr:DUF4424 domain-containing protein [Turneriella sp.]
MHPNAAITSANEEVPYVSHETVTITWLGQSRFSVIVNYQFRNAHLAAGDYAFPETSAFPLENFAVNWAGKNIKAEYFVPPPGRYLRLGNTYYPAVYRYRKAAAQSQEAEQIIRYEFVAPYWREKKFFNAEGLYIEYILTTAQTWRKLIGTVEIHVLGPTCKDLLPVESDLKGKCLSPQHWNFHANNFVPQDDLRLIWRQHRQKASP